MKSTNELLFDVMNRMGKPKMFVKDEEIDCALERLTGYKLEMLQQKSRKHDVLEARQIGMFFYILRGYGIEKAGMRFHRDHATSLNAKKRLMNYYGQKSEQKLTELIDIMSEMTGIEHKLVKQ